MKKSPARACQTPKQNNTLLNYFSRTTPKSNEKSIQPQLIDSIKTPDCTSEKRVQLSNKDCNRLEKETPSKRKTEHDDDDDEIGLSKSNNGGGSMRKNKRFKRIFV
ncbi:hypothetical protein BLA29_003503, partial [Euroglyphus maynei]